MQIPVLALLTGSQADLSQGRPGKPKEEHGLDLSQKMDSYGCDNCAET